MSFAQVILAPWLVWVCSVVALSALALAFYQRPWRVLFHDAGLQHRWLAATLMVAMLWQLRAQAVDWLSLHLLFTTLMTLVMTTPIR